jgi:uncharacterized OsmC-like protein
MAAPRAKVLDYELELDRDGRLAARNGATLAVPAGFSAEHLVLAGLARCTLASLEYHSRRASIRLVGSAARVSGRVTKRESDGRYAFVEIDADFELELDPRPDAAELTRLLVRAERGCFVAASLTAPLRYDWRVNGEVVA